MTFTNFTSSVSLPLFLSFLFLSSPLFLVHAVSSRFVLFLLACFRAGRKLLPLVCNCFFLWSATCGFTISLDFIDSSYFRCLYFMIPHPTSPFLSSYVFESFAYDVMIIGRSPLCSFHLRSALCVRLPPPPPLPSFPFPLPSRSYTHTDGFHFTLSPSWLHTLLSQLSDRRYLSTRSSSFGFIGCSLSLVCR